MLWSLDARTCKNVACLGDEESDGAPTYISVWSLRTLNPSQQNDDHGGDAAVSVARGGATAGGRVGGACAGVEV